jgi:hypothetical protein
MTRHLPDTSFDTAAVVTFAPLGSVRDRRIASGVCGFNDSPSHLKVLVVYSADCAVLVPEIRILRALGEELANAVCGWRKARCTGTEPASFNHTCSGVFLSAMSAVEVW